MVQTPIGQEPNGNAGLDKSPMDMIFYPKDYPIRKISGDMGEGPVARIIYSRPFRAGREIFGDLVKFGSTWRLGANEATEIEFFRNVTIQGTKVNKGRYVLYCIPEEKEWTLILNGDLNTWGLKIDPSKDLYRFRVNTRPANNTIEVFTMEFSGSGNNIQLNIGWDNTMVSLPIVI